MADNSLVTRGQLYQMGLSIPQVDKVLDQLRPLHLKDRRSEPKFVFADFQEIWCTMHKGVWITTTPTRPVRKFIRANTIKEFVSMKHGCLMYDVFHIIKFYSEHRKGKQRYGNISYRKIRTLVYWMWVCRYFKYNTQRPRYEYILEVGAPFNKLIQQAIEKLVAEKMIYWERTTDFDNGAKYYKINPEYKYNFKKTTMRIINSFRGKNNYQEYLHLWFALGLLAKSQYARTAKAYLKQADYDVIYRMFLNRSRTKEFYELIHERIEVVNAPRFAD